MPTITPDDPDFNPIQDPPYPGYVLVGKWLDDQRGLWEEDFYKADDIDSLAVRAEEYLDLPWPKILQDWEPVANDRNAWISLTEYFDMETLLTAIGPVVTVVVNFDEGVPGGNGHFAGYFVPEEAVEQLQERLSEVLARLELYLANSKLGELEEEHEQEKKRQREEISKREKIAAEEKQKAHEQFMYEKIQNELKAAIEAIRNNGKAFAQANHILLTEDGLALVLTENTRGYSNYKTDTTVLEYLVSHGFRIIRIRETYPSTMGNVMAIARATAVGWKAFKNRLESMDDPSIDVDAIRARFKEYRMENG